MKLSCVVWDKSASSLKAYVSDNGYVREIDFSWRIKDGPIPSNWIEAVYGEIEFVKGEEQARIRSGILREYL